MRHRPFLNVTALESRLVPALVINELYVNPPGIDDNREFIELRSLSGGPVTLANVALVEIAGNPTVAGTIASDVHLAGQITGSNGLCLIGEDYAGIGTPWGAQVPAATALNDLTSRMNNDNFTILLVENYTGIIGQDLDINNDGILDSAPWTNILDSVGWHDPSVPNGRVYSPAVLTQSLLTPDAASRFSNNLSASSTAAWYAGELILQGGLPDMTQIYDATRATSNLPMGALITPGAQNFAAPTPPIVTSVVFGDGTNQRSLVKQIIVTFSEPVSFMGSIASALTVHRSGTGGTIGDVSLLASSATGPTNSVTITFSGGFTDPGGSLVDGFYDFIIDAAQVSGTGGALDGNNDQVPGGSYTVTGTTANRYYRLFGDDNGDGTVNQVDFNAFRLAFLAGPNAEFDFDNDGQVSQPDYNAFRLRFLGTP